MPEQLHDRGEFDDEAWREALAVFDEFPHRKHSVFFNTYLSRTNRDAYDTNTPMGHGTLEDYINSPYPWHDRPRCTIISPVALHEEPTNYVVSFVRNIADSAAESNTPIELTLWTNSKVPAITRMDSVYFSSYFAHHSRIACAQYDSFVDTLKDRLGQIPPEYVKLRTRHQFLRPGENFNEIRFESTLSHIKEAVHRYFPVTHIMGWLDSDMPFVGKDAIPRMAEELEAAKAHFARANLVLTERSFEPQPVFPSTIGRVGVYPRSNYNSTIMRDLQPEAAVAAIYGIARQMIERNPEVTDPRQFGYVDESGMFFTIDAWLRSGGPDTTNPLLGESRTMLARAQEMQDRGLLDPSIPLITHVKSARIGNSLRRFSYLARDVHPSRLPDTQDGDSYVDAMSLEHNPTISPELTIDMMTTDEKKTAARSMIERTNHRFSAQTGKGLSPVHWRRLGKIIDKVFGDIRVVRQVDFANVLDVHDRSNREVEFYEWTRDLLGVVDEQVDGQWHYVIVDPVTAMKKITLMHHNHGGQELVPETGGTLMEASQKIDLVAGNGVGAPRCLQSIHNRMRSDSFAPIVIASIDSPDFKLPEHEQVRPPAGNFWHIDGLHRLFGLYGPRAMATAKEMGNHAVFAFVAGDISRHA